MMKTMEQFFAEVKENRALQQAFQAAVTSGTAEAFLKEQQVDATLAELEAYGKTKSGELADDELESVAGGDISWGSYGEASRAEDVRFEFNVGDRVEVYGGWFFHTFTNRGTIKERKVEQDGSSYRPVYYVRFDMELHSMADKNFQEKWYDQNYLSY